MAASRKSHTGLARRSNAHNQAGNLSSEIRRTPARHADREENGTRSTTIRPNGLAATFYAHNQAGNSSSSNLPTRARYADREEKGQWLPRERAIPASHAVPTPTIKREIPPARSVEFPRSRRTGSKTEDGCLKKLAERPAFYAKASYQLITFAGAPLALVVRHSAGR